MRILVMGGTLFNGLALVHELVRAGHEVSVLNRGRTAAPVELPPSVKRLYADRTDRDQMRAALTGAEFDCVHDMSAYHPADVELMYELLRGRIGHYVFVSSTMIYAPATVLPIDETFPLDRSENQVEYGLHKILCEERLFELYTSEGFPATSVPLSMVFGENNALPDREQRMFARLLAGRPILIPGDGMTLGQVGDVNDQARALCKLSGMPITFGKRYNLTGSQAFTREGYVDVFADVVGRPAEKRFIPTALMDALWDGEISLAPDSGVRSRIEVRSSDEARARMLATRARFQLSTLVQHIAPNLHRWNQSVVFGIDRLRTDIGWQPQHTFRSMVEAAYEWFCRTGLDRAISFDWEFEDEIVRLLDGHRA